MSTTVETPMSQELAIIEQSSQLFQQAGPVLKQHVNSRMAAMNAGKQLLDQAGLGMNEQLDESIKGYLVKINKTLERMKNDRAPITQIFDEIKKLYTSNEKELDIKSANSIPNQLQHFRNDWAAEVIRRNEEAKRLAELKFKHQGQRTEFVAWVHETIGRSLLAFQDRRKQSLTKAFSEITLENFDDKKAGLSGLKTEFPREKLHEVIAYELPRQQFDLLKEEDYLELQPKAHTAYPFEAFFTSFKTHIDLLKNELLEKLPGLKDELLKMKEAQERDAAEYARMQDEKRKREEAEQLRIKQEREEAEKKLAEQAQLQKAQGQAVAMFEQTAETAEAMQQVGEVRNSFEIVVKHHAGWAEIFQFFYMRNCAEMTIEDMGKKTLNAMKKYAEDIAKKDGTRIESKYVEYNSVVKAVNRATK
jgi:hypothetical protein